MSRWGPRRFGGAGGGGGGGGASTYLGLTDTPGAYTTPGAPVVVNPAGTGLIESTFPGGDVTDRTNNSGGPMPAGTIVAPSSTVALGLVDADPATDVQASRPVGIVTEVGGIADLASGAVRTISGRSVPVLLVAALTLGAGVGELRLGQEVVVSLTPGSATVPGSGVSEPVAALTVKQRVGLVIDLLTYDGGGDLLVLIQIDFGQRRVN